MTGNLGLVVLLVAPVLGAVIARLFGHTHLLAILAGALLGEWLAFLALIAWSSRLLRSALAAPPNRLLAVAPIEQSFVDRLTAFGFLAVAALVIGAFAFFVMRAAGLLDA